MPPIPLVFSVDKITHICEALILCTAETPGENHQFCFHCKVGMKYNV